MSVRTPVSQAPTRVPIDPNGRLAPEWVRWLNQVSSASRDWRDFEETINPSSVSANTTDEQSFTVDGVDSNDIVVTVNKPSHTAGLGIVNYRAGSDKVFITFGNFTGSPIDPPEEEYLILVIKGS